MRYLKQNSVIRLKLNILAPQKFWAGYAIERREPMRNRMHGVFGCCEQRVIVYDRGDRSHYF